MAIANGIPLMVELFPNDKDERRAVSKSGKTEIKLAYVLWREASKVKFVRPSKEYRFSSRK